MVSLLQLGQSCRADRILSRLDACPISPDEDLCGRRILFFVAVDPMGPDMSFYSFLRRLRQNPHMLRGSIGALIIDGTGELYTKSAAQELLAAANQAGCLFPGRPMVEGTGSLYNQHIQAKNLGLSLEETYLLRAETLVQRLRTFSPPRFRHPRVLMLHASDNRRSNTLELGRALSRQLSDCCTVRELQLLNGTIHDCRGCGYQACLHFAQNNTCFYGGVLSDEVLPAVRDADLLLFLCPNYNDALSANLTALINRMTSLVVQQELSDTYLSAIVVSGYSGGDLVARQLMGAMCLNRGCILPPDACLTRTANDPGDAMAAADTPLLLQQFARQLRRQLLPDESASLPSVF